MCHAFKDTLNLGFLNALGSASRMVSFTASVFFTCVRVRFFDLLMLAFSRRKWVISNSYCTVGYTAILISS